MPYPPLVTGLWRTQQKGVNAKLTRLWVRMQVGLKRMFDLQCLESDKASKLHFCPSPRRMANTYTTLHHKLTNAFKTSNQIFHNKEKHMATVDFEDLSVGQFAEYAKTVTEADILLFTAVSGDNNPVHLNAEYAEAPMFKGRIAHGMLSAGFISTILGTRLPGEGTIYLGQTLKFKAPVRIGDTVTARATVLSLDPAKKRVVLSTVCTVKGAVVIEGEATVIAPSRG